MSSSFLLGRLRAFAGHLVVLLSFASHVAVAQPATRSGITPEEVVVTANRYPVLRSELISDVVVIDQARIRDAAGSTLEDLLRDLAGVQLSRTGAPGQSAGIFIRGASMANTVVLVDGVRIGSGTLGQAALEALALASIERIEVLRGPGSALYGADAVGGVVQVFTRRGRAVAPRFHAAVHAGQFGSSEVQGGASGGMAGFDYALSVSREASQGVSAVANPADAFGRYNADADGFKRGSANAQIGYAPTPSQRIGIRLLESRQRSQYDAAEFTPPTFAPDASPDFRNRLNTRVAALTHSLDALAWRSELSLSESRDVLESGGSAVDRFDTRRRQLAWLPSLRISPDTTLLGMLEHQQMRVSATPFRSAVRDADNSAVGISASGRVNVHRWQLDVRHDAHEVYGAQTTGKLGYAWQLAPEWLLRTSVGNAFRAPSFNELYYPGYGVESIQPERARSAELGAAWRRGVSGVQATVYDNRVNDLIGYQADPGACPAGYSFGCAANVSRARLRGASLAAESAQGPWHWRVGAEFVDAKDLGTGERLTRRAARTANAALSYRAQDWSVQMALNAVGQRPEGGAQLGAYELLDLGGSWRFSGQWRIEAKLLNALNRRYEPAKDYGAFGRQAWVGLRFDSLGF